MWIFDTDFGIFYNNESDGPTLKIISIIEGYYGDYSHGGFLLEGYGRSVTKSLPEVAKIVGLTENGVIDLLSSTIEKLRNDLDDSSGMNDLGGLDGLES